MMTATEILDEIYKLPLVERKKIKQNLLNDAELKRQIEPKMSQDDFDQILLEDGLLVNFPVVDEGDDDFEPIEISGKPISETIIEERR